MKRVLLLGASGFIGQKVFNALHKCDNIFIHAVSQRQLVSNPSISKVTNMDIGNITLFRSLSFENYDVILHLATVYPTISRSRSNLFTVNTSSVLAILDRVVDVQKSNQPIFVFFSAMSIFRGTGDRIITHETQCSSYSEYDLSKAASELCLKSYPNSVIIRIPLLLEPGASRSWLTETYNNLLSDKEVTISNPSALYNHIVDFDCILSFLLMLINRGPSLAKSIEHPVNLASDKPLSIHQIIELMRSKIGSSSRIVHSFDSKTCSLPPLISIKYAQSLGIRPKSTFNIVSQYVDASLA